VYLNEGIKSIKKGTIARLEEREDGFYLVKRRFFISKKEEKIDFTDAIFTQGSLKSKIVDENINLTLFLNRSYHRYMQEIANKMGAKKQLDNEILALGSGNGFISNVKNMFNEKDVEELKFIE